jgi:hypothetical protein
MGIYKRLGFGDAPGDIGPWTNETGGTIDGNAAPGLGLDLSTIYQTDWPGVMNTAATLWPGAQPLVNPTARPDIPLAASQAPPLLQAPSGGGGGTSPVVLILGAVALYFFVLK